MITSPLPPDIRHARGTPSILRTTGLEGGSRRQMLEHYIRERFKQIHGASLQHFMPTLISIESPEGDLQGVVGLRHAEDGPLFLERYLDVPIDVQIERETGQRPERRHIIEIGNLACTCAGASRRLIIALAEELLMAGHTWVTFTGTPFVVNSFRRMGLPLFPLAVADPSRLGDEAKDWGSYYSTSPHVMAGHLATGVNMLNAPRVIDVA